MQQDEMEMFQALMAANFRFEVLIRGIIDVLGKKTGPDGKPLLSVEEVAQAAEILKKEAMEKSKIARPVNNSGIILPGGNA